MELHTIGIDLGKPVFHLPLFLPGKTVHLSMGNAQGLPLVVMLTRWRQCRRLGAIPRYLERNI